MLKRMGSELPAYCTYHSIAHTKDVLSAAASLAKVEGVKGEDLILLKTAIVFHDSGFIKISKGHEKQSCIFAKQILPGYEYSANQINKICSMIMATQIPQSPKTHLEKIICDADLDYLGRNDYFTISELLIQEMRAAKDISLVKWRKIQINFFREHHYHTTSANKKRLHKKNLNMQKITNQK